MRLLLFVLIFLTIPGYGQNVRVFKSLRDSIEYGKEQRDQRINSFIKSANRISIPDHAHLVDVENGFPIFRAPLNDGAARTSGARELLQGTLGFTLEGEGITVGIWDDGLVSNHVEFGQRILSKEGDVEKNHATHVTGTIIAQGVSSAARGMAPKAKAKTWTFDNDEIKMLAQSQAGLILSNHSYGTVTGWTRSNGQWVWSGNPQISPDEDYRFGFYGNAAKVNDEIAFHAPYYTIVWAAGNDRAETGDGSRPPDCNGGTGYDCIIPDAVAKNIITVGAVNKVPLYISPSSVVMSNFSSWGPTDDGRIKPDITGAGVDVLSTSSHGVNAYGALNGTSMATPNVTGSLALLQELHAKLNAGRFMKASTLKALVIHTAKEAGTHAGPDYRFGWGLIDATQAAHLLASHDRRNIFLHEKTLVTGEQHFFDLEPEANTKITVTITWTDPPGFPVAPALDPITRMLVNDLDIRIIDEAGNEVQLPWILDPSSPATQATKGDNNRDNVEKIEFLNPLKQKYRVRVRHKGQLVNGKQDYSLIISHTSAIVGQTYYWIGNSGQWNDGSKWSLSAGGVAANAVPGIHDRVVLNDLGFSSPGVQTIQISANAQCREFIVLTDKEITLNVTSAVLSIAEAMVVSGKNTSIHGNIALSSTKQTSEFNYHSGDLVNAVLSFDGNWIMHGDVDVQAINVAQGTLTVKATTLSAVNFSIAANTCVDMTNVEIKKLKQGAWLSSNVITTGSSIVVDNHDAQFQWNDIDYKGKLVLQPHAALRINGNNNRFLIIESHGDLTMNGNHVVVEELFINAGHLQLQDQLTLVVRQTLEMKDGVHLLAPQKAFIDIDTYQKFCFENIAVTNVDKQGKGILNAGSNSAVENSQFWLRKNCDEVLYASFSVSYPCEGGPATFTVSITGSPALFHWSFGDGVTLESSVANLEYEYFEAGLYDVTLIATKGSESFRYIKPVIIQPNTLPANDIILQFNNKLLSTVPASSYQWYHNGLRVDSGTDRSFDFGGSEGFYSVVISDGYCKRTSNPLIVTATNLIEENTAAFYPNPANEILTILLKAQPFETIYIIVDAMGREVVKSKLPAGSTTIDVGALPNGIYVVHVLQKELTTGKVLIRH